MLFIHLSLAFCLAKMHPTHSRVNRSLKVIDNILLKYVIFHLTLLFAFVVFPMFLLFGVTFFLNRQLAILTAKTFRPSLAKPLTLLSSGMANLDEIYTNPYNLIVACVFLEGTPDINQIRTVFRKNLLEKVDSRGKWVYPEFMQNIGYWMSYPFWRKLENYSPEMFLQECIRLYSSEDENYDFFKLQKLVKELCFIPFSKDKPLFEFLIIPNYTPHPEKNAALDPNKKYFALICKQHHALADGVATFLFIQKLSIVTHPDGFEFLKPNDYTHQRSGYSFLRHALRNAILTAKIMYDITEFLLLDEITSIGKGIWSDRKEETKKTLDEDSLDRVSNLKMAFGRVFSMSYVNQIKKLHGVSGTAVLYSSIVGAIQRTMFSYLDKIPPFIGLSMPLPLPGHKGKLRNRNTFGVTFLPLGEKDPIVRLHKVNEKIDKLKRSMLPAGIALITSILYGQLPRWTFPFVQDKREKAMELVALSNLAGPKELFDICSHQMHDFMWGTGIPIDKRFPFINFTTVGRTARMAVMADVTILESDEQAEQLMETFFEELNLLQDLGQKREIEECDV